MKQLTLQGVHAGMVRHDMFILSPVLFSCVVLSIDQFRLSPWNSYHRGLSITVGFYGIMVGEYSTLFHVSLEFAYCSVHALLLVLQR